MVKAASAVTFNNHPSLSFLPIQSNIAALVSLLLPASSCTSTMAKHRVDDTDRDNKTLVATADITPGEEILSEEPLAELQCGLSDIQDEKRFYNAAANAKYTGVHALKKMFAAMSQPDRDRLEALYNKDEGLHGLISTNVFGHDDEDEHSGQLYRVLRVYHDISRANHSCRPNAVLAWDPQSRRGHLRALRRIAQGEEITINYLLSEKHSLAVQETRRAHLSRHWGFDCNCEVCSLAEDELVNDDQLRTEAKRLFVDLEARATRDRAEAENPRNVRYTTARNAQRTKLANANRYVELLEQLHVRDGRLAWAYEYVADTQEETYELVCDAEDVDHCNDCAAPHTASRHLELAHQAWHRADRIDLLIFGPNHPRVEKNRQVMNRVQAAWWETQ